MERQAANFYEKSASQTTDVSLRQLFTHLAEVERGHERRAEEITEAHLTRDTKAVEESARRRAFVLQYVQPGLAGLIDGSVSTLAPLFAAAFATHHNWETFLVGLAASVGAGISMGFTEALSDDGVITGRGSPVLRGIVCGVMTTVGGIGHTLPYLVPDSWPNAFYLATTIATFVVAVELLAIAWIRTRYMDTPFLRAMFQVVVGGVLVLLAGILIGSA
jgi:rubrerythrin